VFEPVTLSLHGSYELTILILTCGAIVHFVHLLASGLAACLMHVASFSLPLSAFVFPFSHY
jgi:hypothetical protein